MIDLHCHMLPAIDDGAPGWDTALEMARIAIGDGIRVTFCTPHIYPGLYENTAQGIRASVTVFEERLQQAGLSLKLGCSFAGQWIVKLNIGQGSMALVQNGANVTGTYFNGSLKGTVTYEQGLTVLSGTWFANNQSGPLKFYLVNTNGLQFQGNYNGSVEWCGWRSNSAQPRTCLRR